MKVKERVLEGEVLAPESEEQRRTRERLQFVAWLLDSSIPVPGTRLTIGLDAIVGVVPFLGDVIGVLASSYILAEANRQGFYPNGQGAVAMRRAVERRRRARR